MMKLVLSLVVSVLSGIAVLATGFSPVQGALRWREGRRRLQYALGLSVFGFLLVLAGLQLALVDLVFQYEGQGFVLWNTLLLWAALVGGVGLLVLAAAKWALPSPKAMLLGSFSVNPQAEVFRLVDMALSAYMKAQASSQAPTPPPSQRPPQPSTYVH